MTGHGKSQRTLVSAEAGGGCEAVGLVGQEMVLPRSLSGAASLTTRPLTGPSLLVAKPPAQGPSRSGS